MAFTPEATVMIFIKLSLSEFAVALELEAVVFLLNYKFNNHQSGITNAA